jgi:3-methylcrotonyl-CoA carboxylase alpha subunit
MTQKNRTIKKLLVANRGEIACRVMRTAKKLGIATVAVYSDADARAQHVLAADEAVRLGPAPSKDSYLNIDQVIAAAIRTGADAIHPGYGFLSENGIFAEACASNDLIFVGPPAAAIHAMGSKAAAKQIMEQAGVPLLPGYHGDKQDKATLKQAADDMGYPVLLKAVAGGGGKGMRQVHSSDEFAEALVTAKREAMSSFADDVMLVEKYLTRPRHVEVQVFFDQHGNGVYLFERDCSVQRRHQKIIEEAPAPGVDETLRQALGEAAVKAGAAIDYVGAGTVEFLLDEDGTFYFMEMNTRLQVEHPVTEYITGEDLVAWQIRVAEGGKLPKAQHELKFYGHAFEARVYAEDPDNQFLPQTGTLLHCQPPLSSEFVRVDSGVVQGDEISVHYDPMIAKLITWDLDRERALSRLTTALGQYQIAGVTTNIPFLRRLGAHPAFANAELSTAFIAEHEADLFAQQVVSKEQLLTLAMLLVAQKCQMQENDDPWKTAGWQLNGARQIEQAICVSGQEYKFQVTLLKDSYRLVYEGESFEGGATIRQTSASAWHCRFSLNDAQGAGDLYFAGNEGKWFIPELAMAFTIPDKDLGEGLGDSASADFSAPMNGTVVEVAVQAGDKVAAGAMLVVMEAMKMEHAIYAPAAGTVTEVFCQQGQLVDGGAELLAFEVASDG